MLGHRLRRRPNISPALAQCLVLGGNIMVESTSHESLKLFIRLKPVYVCVAPAVELSVERRMQ